MWAGCKIQEHDGAFKADPDNKKTNKQKRLISVICTGAAILCLKIETQQKFTIFEKSPGELTKCLTLFDGSKMT